MQRIREWMAANPTEAREVRAANRSFVFFRITGLSSEGEPSGAQGVPLTPLRSIAVDKIHVYGTPFFIDAKLPLHWSCELHANLVDEEVIAQMRRAGCHSILMGVESGNNVILEKMRKSLTIERALDAAQIIRKSGIELTTFFLVALTPLLSVVWTVVSRGLARFDAEFFTWSMRGVLGEGGGAYHAIVGTLIIVGTASLIGLPVGIAAGIFCAEYPGSRLATATRFVADVMNGTPSIVVGVFAWAWIVAQQKHFSAFAGAVALAFLMIPMVLRTTEEMVKLVPHSLREAALALGYPRWRTSLSIVVRTTLPGIVTGSLLAVARIAGETAPLLFTALGSAFMSTNVDQPMAALPLVVFTYATGPFAEWHRLAWATALVLILALSFMNSVLQGVTVIATIVMYVYILAVLVDGYLMWRGFKRVLAERLPNVSPKGLLMYGMNRMIQIRRFRMPAPRIKRGDPY